MAEDLSPGQEPIAGLSDDDITPNVYEGGFKTWECSVDLAKQLANSRSADRREPFGSGLHVIEVYMLIFWYISTVGADRMQLGAGSALPSLVIFDHLLSREKIEEFPESKLVLSDYNLSVLRLSTIPNLLLTWCARQHLLHPGLKGDLDVSSDLCSRFLLDLQSNNIQIICISGAWTPEFVQLIPKQPADQLSPLETVVLASETIYSPATLPSFVDTLLDILRQSRASQQSAIGLVAAKRVYFGVGGGVDEFLRALEERDVGSTVVWESSETGVGRLILEVKI